MTPILGKPTVTVGVGKAWAQSKGATRAFVSLARIYWREGPQRGSVRPEVAYAQAALETNFGRFGGVIDASYRNPCGMKKSSGGDNYDPSAHQRFRTWTEGIRAHLDHLALYTGARGYPRKETFDPRHFPTLLGTAKTVEALGGKWAPSPTYGVKITRYAEEMAVAKPKVRKRPKWARDLPPLVYRESPNQSARASWSTVEVIICHTPEAPYSIVGYLRDPSSQVSYHILLSEDGKVATQLVPWDRKAWHALDDNSRSEGLSVSGWAASFQPRSEAGRVFARMVAYRLHKRGLPPKWTRGKRGVRGFCRHADVQSDRSDPMNLAKWAVFVYMVKREYRRGNFRDEWGRS